MQGKNQRSRKEIIFDTDKMLLYRTSLVLPLFCALCFQPLPGCVSSVLLPVTGLHPVLLILKPFRFGQVTY